MVHCGLLERKGCLLKPEQLSFQWRQTVKWPFRQWCNLRVSIDRFLSYNFENCSWRFPRTFCAQTPWSISPQWLKHWRTDGEGIKLFSLSWLICMIANVTSTEIYGSILEGYCCKREMSKRITVRTAWSVCSLKSVLNWPSYKNERARTHTAHTQIEQSQSWFQKPLELRFSGAKGDLLYTRQ